MNAKTLGKTLFFLITLSIAGSAYGATIIVDTTVQCNSGAAAPLRCGELPSGPPTIGGDQDGKCSFGEALEASRREEQVDGCTPGNGTDTIVLTAGIYQFTQVDNFNLNACNGPNALPVIEAPVIIDGGGVADLVGLGSDPDGDIFFRLAHVRGLASFNNLSINKFNPGCDPLFCGDGIVQVDVGEQCDDGERVDGDGCSADCQLESCGNGIVENGEQCDPGDTSGPPCDFNCRRLNSGDNASCGNGVKEPVNGEQCDDGGLCSADGSVCDANNPCPVVDGAANDCIPQSGDGCDSFCQLESCGDGIVDAPAELCDDGGRCLDVTTGELGAFCDAKNPCSANRQEICAPQNGDGCTDQCQPEICDECYNGGALLVGEEGDDNNGGGGPGILEIHQSTLKGNSTLTTPHPLTVGREDGIGGAVATEFLSTVEITDSIFAGNVSSIGGAIVMAAGNLNIGNSTFTDNLVIAEDSSEVNSITGLGGAIGAAVSNVTIEQSAFHSNLAGEFGGGLAFLCSDVGITNTSVFENEAKLGGGFFILGDPNICQSIFDDGGDGGRNDGGDGSRTDGNQIVTNDTIRNSLQTNAYLDVSSTELQQARIVFPDPGSTDPFVIPETYINIFSSTIARNLASEEGGGVFSLNSNTSMRNAILAENTAKASGPNYSGGLNSNDFNLLGDLSGAIVAAMTNDIMVSPDTDAGLDVCDTSSSIAGEPHCPLLASSIANDTGSNDCPADDQLGTDRYGPDAACDRGAIELNDSRCGNGVVEPPFESCDEGGACSQTGTACTSDFDCDPILKFNFCEPIRHPGCSEFCILESCGNGILDKDEECDDGQHCLVGGSACTSVSQCPVDANGDPTPCVQRNGDGCNNACNIESCGDGVTDPDGPDNIPNTDDDEECDDGNNVDNDACGNDCQGPVCGNGEIEALEECEFDADGNPDVPDNCYCHPDSCELECGGDGGNGGPNCGNGVLDTGEECDDGGVCSDDPNVPCTIDNVTSCADPNSAVCITQDKDGCGRSCQIEECGDGITNVFVDPVTGQLVAEECDDGNIDNHDLCTDDCKSAVCGDGHTQGVAGEQCDDGGVCSDDINVACTTADVSGCVDPNSAVCLPVSGDGCSEFCQPERCGDGVLDLNGIDNDITTLDDNEECDDGAQSNGDGCDANCKLEACGDGIQQPSEECDDNNLIDGDGCNHLCREERCGDGVLDPDGADNTIGGGDDEECDDGNQSDNDGCSATCQLEACGDNIQQPSEECDDGDLDDNDGCSHLCREERCGDGIQQSGEDCDDGNQSSGDGCSDTCVAESCGDGSIQPLLGEECEPPNSGNCDAICHVIAPFCGDGNTDPGEECDDGAGNSTDPDATCRPGCVNQRCGDGILDPNDGEECDDGNQSSGDGCSDTCVAESCGDGSIQPLLGEQCEPPSVDDCDAACQLIAPFCGDGNPDPGEECDDGAANSNDPDANCRPGCVLSRCGDGIRDSVAGEECDDGNQSSGDGCSDTCVAESCGDGSIQPLLGEECEPPNSGNCDAICHVIAPFCGDGNTDPGEDCDNGAGNSTDPDASCRPGCINQRCGDGILDPNDGEECDDGNQSSGDGCSDICIVEPRCGNGVVEGTEVCDDGNVNPNDGCTTSCLNAACGDGFVQFGTEDCDDGNNSNGDGCSESCEIEARCGDGNLDDGEECDDANNNSLDGCSSTCVIEECGDGITQATLGEECDDGNDTDDDECSNTCEKPSCGDGVPQAGEDCDDGNTDPHDSCKNDCSENICGDGVVQLTGDGVEECDDGNGVNDDSCSDECIEAVCGDGIVQIAAGEECDPEDGVDYAALGLICANCELEGGSCGNGIPEGSEECDDGDNDNSNSCTNNCTQAFCGDSIVGPGEECDNGVANQFYNKCLPDCTSAFCGDGFVQSGVEQCDDANGVDGDGCDTDCMPSDGSEDFCPTDPEKDFDVDSDGDGVLDCNDECPDDPNKTEEGDCGCGEADLDENQNGITDCLETGLEQVDQCPDDPDKTDDVDSDGDGVLDCNDDCPDDPQRVELGACDRCEHLVVDVSAPRDGFFDCLEVEGGGGSSSCSLTSASFAERVNAGLPWAVLALCLLVLGTLRKRQSLAARIK